MIEHSIELLRELTEADGLPGFEDEAREIFRRRLEGEGEILQDRLGGVVGMKRGAAESPKVMIDCHLDEIGFIVRHITAQGFLKFHSLGSWPKTAVPAQRVRVLVGKEKIPGVVGSIPPHFLKASNRSKAPEISDLFIDIGASSRKEAESWGVRPGLPIAPDTSLRTLKNPRLIQAKALDNRVGCALAIEAFAAARSHPNTLYACGSVQEEVGGRGAKTAADLINPDVGIVLEGPPGDDTPGQRLDEAQCAMGKGVQIRLFDPTMITNPRFAEFAIKVAEQEGIAHQLAVRTGGGTDAKMIHVHGRGVPCIVLGVPVRYIHSSTGHMNLDDYESTLKLTEAIISRLDSATVESFG